MCNEASEIFVVSCFDTCLAVQVYTLGTILSMQISFVGFQPVQSSEHMAVSRWTEDVYSI